MGFKERLRAAWEAFWNTPELRDEGAWPGYCMVTARCSLDAGHPGRCDWV